MFSQPRLMSHSPLSPTFVGAPHHIRTLPRGVALHCSHPPCATAPARNELVAVEAGIALPPSCTTRFDGPRRNDQQ